MDRGLSAIPGRGQHAYLQCCHSKQDRMQEMADAAQAAEGFFDAWPFARWPRHGRVSDREI